jgi:hypothetical protein
MESDTPISAGAIKGIARRTRHAVLYYEMVRNRNSDVTAIARNTGWTVESIARIREHLLANGLCRFDPSYEISVAWQHLVEGRRIQTSDLVFLKHEYLESILMERRNLNYSEAHERSNSLHDWWRLIGESNERHSESNLE